MRDDTTNDDAIENRKRLMAKLRTGCLVVYFIGILHSLRNRVKVMGALRPVEHLKEFEKEKKPVKVKGNSLFVSNSVGIKQL